MQTLTFNIKPLLMRLQTRFVSEFCHKICLLRAASVLVLAVIFTVTGCATSPEVIPTEPRSIAKRLGFSGCRVSVPLSQEEVIEIGRKWEIYTTPEVDPEWHRLVAAQQSGDQLRLIDCKGAPRSFYALFRGDAIVLRYYPLTMD